MDPVTLALAKKQIEQALAAISDQLVPEGGDAGQVLAKSGEEDWQMQWESLTRGNLDGGRPASVYADLMVDGGGI